MKKILLGFLLLFSLIFTSSSPTEIRAQTENVEEIKETKEVQNFSETQGFPDTCKIPVTLYLAIFIMSVGVVIYVK